MEFTINTLSELRNASDYIKMNYWQHKIYTLWGPLGIGKTQLIKYLLKEYEVTSPTFALLNIYGDKYWHFDLYTQHMVDTHKMEELSFHNIWNQHHNKCFIEWPEKLNFSLKSLQLRFFQNNNRRVLKIEGENI